MNHPRKNLFKLAGGFLFFGLIVLWVVKALEIPVLTQPIQHMDLVNRHLPTAARIAVGLLARAHGLDGQGPTRTATFPTIRLRKIEFLDGRGGGG